MVEEKWLSKETIDLAQNILFKNFALTRGFEDTTLGPLNMFSTKMVTELQSVVYLYDSSQKENPNKNLIKQIAR